jgi:hypothetical protein
MIRTATQRDTEATADQCLQAANDLHEQYPKATISFRLDADGLGAGVYDKLKRVRRGQATKYTWPKVREIRNGAKARKHRGIPERKSQDVVGN